MVNWCELSFLSEKPIVESSCAKRSRFQEVRETMTREVTHYPKANIWNL